MKGLYSYKDKYCKGRIGILTCEKQDTCIRYKKNRFIAVTPKEVFIDGVFTCEYYIPKDETFFRKLKIKKLIKKIK